MSVGKTKALFSSIQDLRTFTSFRLFDPFSVRSALLIFRLASLIIPEALRRSVQIRQAGAHSMVYREKGAYVEGCLAPGYGSLALVAGVYGP